MTGKCQLFLFFQANQAIHTGIITTESKVPSTTILAASFVSSLYWREMAYGVNPSGITASTTEAFRKDDSMLVIFKTW